MNATEHESLAERIAFWTEYLKKRGSVAPTFEGIPTADELDLEQTMELQL